jgi:hypothetical protein
MFGAAETKSLSLTHARAPDRYYENDWLRLGEQA